MDYEEVSYREEFVDDIFLDEFNLESRENFLEDELQQILNFLKNPINTGFWKFSGKLKINGGFIKDMQNLIKEKAKEKEITDNETDKTINLGDIIHELYDETKKFSFIFSLLSRFSKKSIKKRDYEPSREYKLFSILDLEEFKRNNEKSIEFFQKNIFFSDFKTSIRTSDIFRIKNGFFILSLKDDNYFEIFSIFFEPLRDVRELFQQLNLIESSKIEKIFSPEENLLRAYIMLLKNTPLEILTDNKSIQNSIGKAIVEYFGNNYQYSISTTGIAAENILTQIYETYFRKSLRRGTTLGQIVDEIAKETKTIVRGSQPRVFNADEIHAQINEYNKNGKPNITFILKNLTDFSTNIKKETLEIIKSVSEIRKHEITIFPTEIEDNLEDLIRYRNATSHKSRDFIGVYEGSKAIYCLINLMRWWEEEKNNIDWSNSKEEIIKKSYEHSRIK